MGEMDKAAKNNPKFVKREVKVGNEELKKALKNRLGNSSLNRCRRSASSVCTRWTRMDDLLEPPARHKLGGRAKLGKFNIGIKKIAGSKIVNQVKPLKQLMSAGGKAAWRVAGRALKTLPAGPLEVVLTSIQIGVTFGSYIDRWETQTEDETLTQLPLFFAELISGQDPKSDGRTFSLASLVGEFISEDIAKKYVNQYREQALEYCRRFDELSKEMNSPEYTVVRNVLSMTGQEASALFPEGVGEVPTASGKVYVDFGDQLINVPYNETVGSASPVFVISHFSGDSEELIKAGTGLNLMSTTIQDMHQALLMATAEIATITRFYEKYIYQPPPVRHQFSAGRQGVIHTGSKIHRELAAKADRPLEEAQANYIKGILEVPSGKTYNKTVDFGKWLEVANELGIPTPSAAAVYQDKSALGRHQIHLRNWEAAQAAVVADTLQTLEVEGYVDLPDEDRLELARSIAIFPSKVTGNSRFTEIRINHDSDENREGPPCHPRLPCSNSNPSKFSGNQRSKEAMRIKHDSDENDEGLPYHPRWPRSVYEGSISTAASSRQSGGWLSTLSGALAALSISKLAGGSHQSTEPENFCDCLSSEDYSAYKYWKSQEELIAAKTLVKAVLNGRCAQLPAQGDRRVRLVIPDKVLADLQLSNDDIPDSVDLKQPTFLVGKHGWQLKAKQLVSCLKKNLEFDVKNNRSNLRDFVNGLLKVNIHYCSSDFNSGRKGNGIQIVGFFPAAINERPVFLMIPHIQPLLLSENGEHVFKVLRFRRKEAEINEVGEGGLLPEYTDFALEVSDTQEYIDKNNNPAEHQVGFYIIYSDKTPKFVYIIFPPYSKIGDLELRKFQYPVLIRFNISSSLKKQRKWH